MNSGLLPWRAPLTLALACVWLLGAQPDATARSGRSSRSAREAAKAADAAAEAAAKAAAAKAAHSALTTATVEAINRFGVEAYGKLAERHVGNIAISPLNLSGAVALAWAGAKGETATDLAKVLQLSSDAPTTPSVFGELRRAVAAGSGRGSYRWHSGCALILNAERRFDSEFVTLLREGFDGECYLGDYTEGAEPVRAALNRWGRRQTGYRVVELAAPSSLSGGAGLTVAAAAYFAPRLADGFEKSRTVHTPFHLTSQRFVVAPMMRQTARLNYGLNALIEVVELPCEGGDVSLFALLPRDWQILANLEKDLNVSNLNKWLGDMREARVTVHLPRLSLEYGVSAGETLAALGMKTASTSEADFTGLGANGGLRLGEALHKVRLDLREGGGASDKAAGATRLKKAKFVANRPFLLVARDDRTGVYLLISRVANPTVIAQDQPLRRVTDPLGGLLRLREQWREGR
jgi:serpin B